MSVYDFKEILQYCKNIFCGYLNLAILAVKGQVHCFSTCIEITGIKQNCLKNAGNCKETFQKVKNEREVNSNKLKIYKDSYDVS